MKNPLCSTELEKLSVLLCLICVKTLSTLNNPVDKYIIFNTQSDECDYKDCYPC